MTYPDLVHNPSNTGMVFAEEKRGSWRRLLYALRVLVSFLDELYVLFRGQITTG